MSHSGKVYLVGAGPGDPELITEWGKRLLSRCDVVVYDHLASEELLMLCTPQCKKIYVGKQKGKHSVPQDEINQIIVKEAKNEHQVVRLKGGDPFVFGRGGEEILALEQEKIPYQVVPGITSAIAALTSAGIPITHRGVSRSFHVITGHTADSGPDQAENYEALAKLNGTLVFLMGLSHIEQITKCLLHYGKAPKTKAAVISNGTLPNQKKIVGTLQTIAEIVKKEPVPSPAILVFGEVAGFSFTNDSHLPLYGCKVGITGTKAFTKKLACLLKEEGAVVSVYDYLAVQKMIDLDTWIRIKDTFDRFTWLVFTSTNGIRLFFDAMKLVHLDIRSLFGKKIAVIGPGTKDTLEEYGIYSDYMPDIYTTKALGEGLIEILDETDRILLPRARKVSSDLTDCLKTKHILYEEIALYDTKADKKKCEAARKEAEDLEYLTFASSSGVHAFMETGVFCRESLKHCKIVCIGEVTKKTAESYGLTEIVLAKESTYKGIANAIQKADRCQK